MHVAHCGMSDMWRSHAPHSHAFADARREELGQTPETIDFGTERVRDGNRRTDGAAADK